MPNPRSVVRPSARLHWMLSVTRIAPALRGGALSVAVVSLAVLVGCNAGSSQDSAGDDAQPRSRAESRDPSGSSEPGAAAPMTGSGDFGSSGSAGSGAAGGPMSSGEGEGGDSSGGTSEGAGEADAGVADPITPEPGQLTAGEWSDLEDWSFWRDLHDGDAQCEDTAECTGGPGDGVAARMSSYWGYNTGKRFAVRVTSGTDPVVDAVVQLRDGDDALLFAARTDSRGRAELFAGMFEQSTGTYTVSVEAAGERVERSELDPAGEEPIAIDFPVAHAPPPSLDLMFMVDTTGSMGDELSYIQAELGDVIEQVRDEIGSQLAVRLSVNFYRDRGDEYLVRDFQFTSEIDQALEQLAAQAASGGGDTPEAVEEALDNAVNDHTWSEAATARLLFFVLDAPPHYDDGRLQSLHDSTLAAAEKGVQIIPLAASGIDERTEFLLRMLAIGTNGTYSFLTDHSGIGSSHLEPTIGEYDVELLKDLMVRVIRERL